MDHLRELLVCVCVLESMLEEGVLIACVRGCGNRACASIGVNHLIIEV